MAANANFVLPNLDELPASAILGPEQRKILTRFLTPEEMKSLDRNASMTHLIEVLGRHPGLLEAVMPRSPLADSALSAPKKGRTAGARGIDPYGAAGFAGRKETYKRDHAADIAKRRDIQKNLNELAKTMPPGLEEKIDPELDPFINPQFLTKLWRLVNVIEIIFHEDPEPTVIIGVLETDIIPHPQHWDFVIEQYFDLMHPIFGDIDEALRLHEEGRPVNFEFMRKVSDVPFFKSMNVEEKITSPRLGVMSRRNLLKTLQMLNALSIIHRRLEPAFFLNMQAIGVRVTSEGRIGEINKLFAPENILQCLSFGRKTMENFDVTPFIELLKNKQHWNEVSKAMELVSDVPELSNMKLFLPVLNQLMAAAPAGTYK